MMIWGQFRYDVQTGNWECKMETSQRQDDVAQTGRYTLILPKAKTGHGISVPLQDKKKWPGKHVFNELLIYSHIFFLFSGLNAK